MIRGAGRFGAAGGLMLAVAAGLLVGGADLPREAEAQAPAAAPAPAAPEAGSKRTIQTFEAWTVTCAEEGQRKTCAMSQRLTDPKTGRPVAAWNIGRDGEGRLVSSLRTPTLTALQAGVSLAVDAKPAIGLAYRTCAPAFCEAVLPLGEDMLRTLRAGNTARLAFTDLSQGRIQLPFSLKGFTKALATLQAELS